MEAVAAEELSAEEEEEANSSQIFAPLSLLSLGRLLPPQRIGSRRQGERKAGSFSVAVSLLLQKMDDPFFIRKKRLLGEIWRLHFLPSDLQPGA